MGRVYADEDDHVVVELTKEDILYRFVPDGKGGMLSMRTMIKDLVWFILNTHPTGKKIVEKRLITAAVTEVVDGRFVVEFLPRMPVVPPASDEAEA
jgi:hypothetical protein